MSEVVMGVDLKKVDKKALHAAAHKVGVEPNGVAGTVEEVATAFAKSSEAIYECDVCGGASPKSFEACPFCGSGDSKDDEVQVVTGELVTAADAERVTGSLVTEKDLNEAVDKINRAKVVGAAAYFELGRQILIVHDSQLWKQRRDGEGKPKYKTWGEFVDLELEMSKSMVYGMMGVVSKYTVEQVQKIGRRKLELLLTAPKAAQEKLLAAAARGESVRELEAKVRKANKNCADKKGGAPQKAEPRDGELTLAMLVGHQHKLAFHEPGSEKDDKPKVAKKLRDGCWAFLDLTNGVRQVFHLGGMAQGKPKLIVNAKRDD